MRTTQRPSGTRRAPIVGASAVSVLVALGGAPVAASPTDQAHIDVLPVEEGPTNQALAGIGWNTGSLAGVAELAPPTVRIDGALDQASTGPGELDLAPLVARVEAVREIGATPVVILSYMPRWLAAHGGPFDPRDPTRVRPRDLDQWEALVREVVSGLVAASPGAYRFEVWNEPDIPIFWQDSPDAFIAMALRTHAAVAAGAPGAEVGGPATAFPDPGWMVPYVEAVRAASLPLDFVSWHFYANYPFLGDDGAEEILPPWLLPAYPLLGRENPATNPSEYRFQTAMVRGWVDAALAGAAYDPALVIDEWNLSAGGYDDRHDTHVGAAFAAAALMEMEQAALDGADYYRATNGPGDRLGDWGLARTDGTPEPAWWAFHAWRATAGERLKVDGAHAPDLFARASTHGHTVDVLLSSFTASTAVSTGPDRRVTIEAHGVDCAPNGVVRMVSEPSGTLDDGVAVPVDDGRVALDLPTQSVAWVSLHGCRAR